MSDCPSIATLRLIGTDEIGDVTYAALETHVEHCVECREVLERWVRLGGSLGDDSQREATAFPEIPGFEIDRELGRGSAGVVYLAEEPGLERQVALKIVPGGTVAGPRGRARWTAEARAVSRLRHPNIVRLYRVEETAEWLALVFEYIPGGTLKERISGPLDPKLAAGLLEPVALGVEHIHQRGLLHLDLKPSNILLDGDLGTPLDRLVPKVSDFGIARTPAEFVGVSGSSAGLRGTPDYMSPEQAVPRSAAIGPTTDVFALGAVLYELLTGRPPFQSATVIETIDKIRYDSPIPPRILVPGIPKSLETVCLTCLRKDAGRRYPSAQAVADDLRRVIEGRPIHPRPEPGEPRRRRHPSVAFAAVVVVMIAAALAGSMISRRRDSTNSVDPSRTLQALRTSIREMLENPKLVQDDRVSALLEGIAHYGDGFKRDAEIDEENLASLAILERALAQDFYSDFHRERQKAVLFDHSIQLLTECLRRRPDDQELLWELALSVVVSGEFPQRDLLGLNEPVEPGMVDLLNRHEQAIALARCVRQKNRRMSILARVADGRRSHAFHLEWSGRPDLAERFIKADRAMFADLDPVDATVPELAFRKALALHQQPGSSRTLQELLSTPTQVESEWSSPQDKEMLIREWFVVKFGEAIVLERSAFLPGHDAGEKDWARRVLAAVRSQCRDAGLSDSLVPKTLYEIVFLHLARVSSSVRNHSLDVAVRIQRRTLALTDEFIRLYPEDPIGPMALSETLVQAAKNASRFNEPDAEREFLRLARDAARHASSLDPHLVSARNLVENRERRLARALAP